MAAPRKTQDEGIFNSDRKLLEIHAKRICEHLPRTSSAINSYLSAVDKLDNRNAMLAAEVDAMRYELKSVMEERDELKRRCSEFASELDESRKFTDELAAEIRALKTQLKSYEAVTEVVSDRMRQIVCSFDALRAVDKLKDEEPWPTAWPLETPVDGFGASVNERMMDTDADAERYRRAFAQEPEPLADYPLRDCVKSNAEEIQSGRGTLLKQSYRVRMIVKYDLPYDIVAPSSNAAMNKAEADAWEEHPDASDISTASVREVG